MSGSKRPSSSPYSRPSGSSLNPHPSMKLPEEPHTSFETADFSAEEKDAIQRTLGMNLGPEFISFRPNAGSDVAYLEGNKAIELANMMFGFEGWSSKIKDTCVDFLDVTKDGKFNCGVCATIRIELKGGSYHEDVGYGTGDNQRTKAAALEKARKEAITDGVKRALRFFGNSLGNCIYDKDYIRTVRKIPQSQKRQVPPESLLREGNITPKKFATVAPPAHARNPAPNMTPVHLPYPEPRVGTKLQEEPKLPLPVIKDEDFGDDFDALLSGSQEEEDFLFPETSETLHPMVPLPSQTPGLPALKAELRNGAGEYREAATSPPVSLVPQVETPLAAAVTPSGSSTIADRSQLQNVKRGLISSGDVPGSAGLTPPLRLSGNAT